MYSTLVDSDKRGIWLAFQQISQIPRCSKNEEKILAFLIREAEALGLEFQRDKIGNLLITKPSQGIQGPTVVLQGHVDMVCEKNKGTKHDFCSDPISLRVAEGWVKAQDTTLGADNGIAVAMMLALLRNSSDPHPPLECLFTIDEESALVGALELGNDLLSGQLLINLDSEDQGHFTIGCAGGINVDLSMSLTPGISQRQGYALAVKGFPGGHSGIEIDKGKGNAIKALGDFLWNLLAEDPQLSLVSIEGGDKHNAIPREAFARIRTSLEESRIQEWAQALTREWQSTTGKKGEKISFTLHKTTEDLGTGYVQTAKIITLLKELPDGVAEYSREVQGLVDTSNNLASVRIQGREFKLLTSVRSSFQEKQSALVQKISKIARSQGANTSTSDGYPPWPPSKENPLLNHCRKLYQEAYGEEPIVELVHAGLECGVIGSKYPGMQMISFGPDIRGAHTPQERLRIASAESVYDFLLLVLAKGDEFPQ
jgi:dipeptidase D